MQFLHEIRIGSQEFTPNRFVYKIFVLKFHYINSQNVQSADLILLATDHDDFDYQLIEKEAKLIVDTRGRFSTSDKIIKA